MKKLIMTVIALALTSGVGFAADNASTANAGKAAQMKTTAKNTDVVAKKSKSVKKHKRIAKAKRAAKETKSN